MQAGQLLNLIMRQLPGEDTDPGSGEAVANEGRRQGQEWGYLMNMLSCRTLGASQGKQFKVRDMDIGERPTLGHRVLNQSVGNMSIAEQDAHCYSWK